MDNTRPFNGLTPAQAERLTLIASAAPSNIASETRRGQALEQKDGQ